jgi:hypothetical protein
MPYFRPVIASVHVPKAPTNVPVPGQCDNDNTWSPSYYKAKGITEISALNREHAGLARGPGCGLNIDQEMPDAALRLQPVAGPLNGPP